MGDIRMDAAVRWRAKGNPQNQEGIPVESLGPHDGTASQSAKNLSQVLQLFDMANGVRGITLIMKYAFANMYLRQGEDVDLLSIGVYDSKGSHLAALARCHDLSVIRLTPVANSNDATVALDFHNGDGFSITRTGSQ